MSLFLLISFAILLIVVFYRQRTKNIKATILEIERFLADKTEKEILDVKCVTSVLHGRNTNFLFNRADLYYTTDTFFICGYNKILNFRIEKCVIVVSRNVSEIKSFFPKANFLIVKRLNIDSDNNEVFIEFYDEDFKDVITQIRLKGLTIEERNKINIYK